MKRTANLRRHERSTCDTRGRAMWVDRDGKDKWAIIRIYDLSASGVRMDLPERVEARSVIRFSSDDMKIQGQATVRFCRHQGAKYVVGAEFVGGTAWPPQPKARRNSPPL